MRLEPEQAELLIGTTPVATVSAEAKGADCVVLGGFEDEESRNVEPAHLCLDREGRLRGNVTRTSDGLDERWLMRFQQVP